MKGYKRIISAVMAVMCLAGCSAPASEKKSTADFEQESFVQLGEEEMKEKAKALLEQESYELIWNIAEECSRDTSVWKVSSLSTKDLWEKMNNTFFSDGVIQSSENDMGVLGIEMLFQEEQLMVQVADEYISIDGFLEPEIKEEIRKFLIQETGMDCVKGEARTDLTYQVCYYFQIEGTSLMYDGYTNGMDVISSSYYAITLPDSITIMKPRKLLSEVSTITQEQLVDIEEIKTLCEVQWMAMKLPYVLALENIEIVYRPSIDGTEVIPSYLLTGKRYEKNEYGELVVEYRDVLIDAVTGEIIYFT